MKYYFFYSVPADSSIKGRTASINEQLSQVRMYILLMPWNHVLHCFCAQHQLNISGNKKLDGQHAKKVVSDSAGLVDFAILFLTCPTGKWCFLRNSINRRTVKSILLVKKFLGLVEMMCGLVNASFSLPEWQAVKMIFFAPWRYQRQYVKRLVCCHRPPTWSDQLLVAEKISNLIVSCAV